MQAKIRNEGWNRLPQITSEYFCGHMDELLNRIAQEGISFKIVDSDSGIEVIACPINGVHHRKFESFGEQMEQHYGIPLKYIREDVRWNCTEDGWEDKQ